MQIVNISGKAEHGKDTLALMLKNRLELAGKGALILHYGDYLKFLCRVLYGWNGKKDEAGRRLLQYVGTDKIRSIMPDFWVESVARQVAVLQMLNDEPDFIFVPDCRFPNEIEWWEKNGYKQESIRVIRPHHVSKLTKEQLEHLSETALDNYPDFNYIVTAEDMEGLNSVADRLVNCMLTDEIF